MLKIRDFIQTAVILLCVAAPFSLAAQENISMRFTRLSIENGLSQSTINDIIQDSRGFLWFATEDGLNRYDGYRFTVFKHKPGDSTSISNNSISCILEDKKGNLWIGTKGGGLNKFDRQTETFKRYRNVPGDSTSLSHDFVTALHQDFTGVILVGTQGGLNIYRPSQDDFLRYRKNDRKNSLNGNWITSLYQDRNEILWIGTQDNGLNRFNRVTEEFTHYTNRPGDPGSLSDNWVVTVYEDKKGNLWVGTQGGGLNRFNRRTETFEHYRHRPGNPNSLGHDWVLTVFEDRYGELWVGTMNGLSILDRENNAFINLSELKDAPALSNKSISALYEDRSGVFWVGTKDDALHKFVRSSEYFTVYDYQPAEPMSLSDNNVWAIYETTDGSLWIGTQGGGVNRISPDRNSIRYYRHDPDDPGSLSDNFVNDIYEDSEGRIWVATISGIDEYIPEDDEFKHYTYDPGNPNSPGGKIITTIYEDRTGELWFGTLNNGLTRYDKETGTFTNYRNEPGNSESLSHNKIWSFYEDRNGAFWVGTHGYGLNKYDRKNDVFKRYVHDPSDPGSISGNFINFIYQDQNGRYWIGTLNGLNKFYPQSELFRTYTTNNGLPNDVIYGIIEDERGHLWLSTNRGISDFNPEKNTFRNYDIGDGLPTNEYRFGAYHKGESGKMYFGGIKGVVAFEPDSIRDNPYIPPVVITGFEIYNNPVNVGNSPLLSKSIVETDHIDLTYEEKVFSFEFSALHYAAPDQNQYAYKLEGFDDNWQNIEHRRFTSFTNLPHGEYVFRVKAANKDGVWNEEGTKVRISIAPPPWKTWWAYTIYSFVGIGMIAGFVQLRIEKERKKKRRLQRQNEKLEVLVGERTKELKKEKEKSDRLLYNILPAKVAEELKEMGTTSPQQFQEATILFTDFKEFTSVASTMPADDLVRELDEIFQHFDSIVEEHGLEKIKTIGDAYMAAGGVPKETDDHAVQTVDAAFDMLRYIEERNEHSSVKWQMRAGVHTGSVIAGVVGRRKFTYDLWGDTVILASRMEEAGTEGKVNISAVTHSLVKDDFVCEYRGKVDALGKGKLDMYYVVDKAKNRKLESNQVDHRS